MTGLGIGALVLAIYAYTFYSVSQERFLDELEDEAKAARALSSGKGIRTLIQMGMGASLTCWIPFT